VKDVARRITKIDREPDGLSTGDRRQNREAKNNAANEHWNADHLAFPGSAGEFVRLVLKFRS
jgi:hypothetical protein